MTTFTHSQIGALLVAVGEQMWDKGLCFDATFDGLSRDEMRVTLLRNLPSEGKPGDVADKLLALTPEELIKQLQGEE